MDKTFFRDFLLLLMCPIAAFVIILNKLYHGHLNRLVLISLFMAFVGYLTIPFADSSRHMFLFFSLERSPVNELIYYDGKDFILYSLSNLFAKWHLPFELIKALFVFICYQSSFALYKDTLKYNPILTENKRIQFLVFLIFFLSVPFAWIVNGLRFVTSAYLLLFAFHYFIARKRIKCLSLVYLAIGTHFGILYILPLFLYYCFPVIKINRKQFFVLGIFLLIGGKLLFELYGLSLFKEEGMEKTYNTYVANSDENFTDTTSLNGFISIFLMQLLPIYIVGIIAVFCSKKYSKETLSKIFVSLLFIILVSPFLLLFQRYGYTIIPVLLFFSLGNLQSNRNVRKIVMWLLISCIILFISYTYGYRGIYIYSPFYYLFFPFVFTLSHTWSLSDAVEHLGHRT